MKIVSRTSIHKNLKSLDFLYNHAKTLKEPLFYSKLANLELCGWIEETMDRVVRSCACRTLHDSTNRKQIEDTVIRKTYGFDYENNFRRMIIQVIGIYGVEQLERRMDQIKLAKLKVTFETLKLRRNQEAHTHLKGTMGTFDAPSLTLQHFEIVYDGLKEISEQLKTITR